MMPEHTGEGEIKDCAEYVRVVACIAGTPIAEAWCPTHNGRMMLKPLYDKIPPSIWYENHSILLEFPETDPGFVYVWD